MHLRESLLRLISRFRYSVSLPEDIAHDLGLFLPYAPSFQEFLTLLTTSPYPPTRLRRYMSRRQAEQAFETALRKECFPSCSLFSYYFDAGWLVFTLHFDEEERLRRVYMQCPLYAPIEGSELHLDEERGSASSHRNNYQHRLKGQNV